MWVGVNSDNPPGFKNFLKTFISRVKFVKHFIHIIKIVRAGLHMSVARKIKLK